MGREGQLKLWEEGFFVLRLLAAFDLIAQLKLQNTRGYGMFLYLLGTTLKVCVKDQRSVTIAQGQTAGVAARFLLCPSGVSWARHDPS